MDPPLWSDLYCLNHQQKIEYIDISRGNQANRIFCSNSQCKRPKNALDYEQTKQFTQQVIETYEEQIKEMIRIKNLGKMEISHHQSLIQNTEKMIKSIDQILLESHSIQQGLSHRINSLNQLQRFSELLSESKQNMTQQSDLQNISECLQFYMKKQENISNTIKPLSEQYTESKTILDNQILSNSKLFKNLEEQILSKSLYFGNQCLSDSIQLQQQDIILCPIHQQEVQLISLNIDDKQRAICPDCFGGETRRTRRITELKNHEEEYKRMQNQILCGEDFFFSLIKKPFTQIINILQKIIESFIKNINLIDDIWLQTQKVLHEDDQVFNIKNFEQLEHLAQLHFNTFLNYYCNVSNNQSNLNYAKQFEKSLFSKIMPLNETIAKISDNVIVQTKELLIQLQQNFQIMQQTLQSKLVFRQLENSLITKYKSHEVIQKALFDDHLNMILLQPKAVLLFQMEKNEFVFKTQLNFRYVIKDICLQNQGKWFATASEGQCSELKFWTIQQLQQIQQGRVEIQFEFQGNANEVLQLEVNQKNNNCISFHRNEIIIWSKKKNWEEIQKITTKNVLYLAQFDWTWSQLVILSNDTLQIIICTQNELIEQKNQIFDFKLQEIKNNQIKQMTFLNMQKVNKECLYFLINFEGKVAIIKTDLKTKKMIMLKIFPLIVQSVNSLFWNNFISIIDKDNEALSLYQIDWNQSTSDFNLILVTQIVSRQGFLNSALSQNGKFFATIEQLDEIFKLQIYDYIRMPHINKIPKKSIDFIFSGF